MEVNTERGFEMSSNQTNDELISQNADESRPATVESSGTVAAESSRREDESNVRENIPWWNLWDKLWSWLNGLSYIRDYRGGEYIYSVILIISCVVLAAGIGAIIVLLGNAMIMIGSKIGGLFDKKLGLVGGLVGLYIGILLFLLIMDGAIYLLYEKYSRCYNKTTVNPQGRIRRLISNVMAYISVPLFIICLTLTMYADVYTDNKWIYFNTIPAIISLAWWSHHYNENRVSKYIYYGVHHALQFSIFILNLGLFQCISTITIDSQNVSILFNIKLAGVLRLIACSILLSLVVAYLIYLCVSIIRLLKFIGQKLQQWLQGNQNDLQFWQSFVAKLVSILVVLVPILLAILPKDSILSQFLGVIQNILPSSES